MHPPPMRTIVKGIALALLGFAGLCLGLGGLLSWLGLELSGRGLSDLVCIGGSLLVMFSGVMLLIGIGARLRTLTSKALYFQCDVQPKTARLGEDLDMEVTITPLRPVLAGPGYIRLAKTESFSLSSISTSRTRRRNAEESAYTVVQEVELLTPPAKLRPGMPFHWSACLRVPPDEMASFEREEASASGNDVHAVTWEVAFELRLQGWSDAYKSVDIHVLPINVAPHAVADQAETAIVVRGLLTKPLHLTLARTSVHVGDTLSGTVYWGGGEEGTVWVSAGYRIVVKAETWTTIIGQANFRLAAGGQAPFAFAIPAEGPLSYKGKLFAIRWFVLAQAGEKQQEMEVRVRARGEAQPVMDS